LIVALAMTVAMSSRGFARRSAVSAAKYWVKSAMT
jgi:hypothetical protein